MPSDFVTALLKNFGMPGEPGDKNPSLDWACLGHSVSPLFRAAPGCTTMWEAIAFLKKNFTVDACNF
jgi:hypothetical protein